MLDPVGQVRLVFRSKGASTMAVCKEDSLAHMPKIKRENNTTHWMKQAGERTLEQKDRNRQEEIYGGRRRIGKGVLR